MKNAVFLKKIVILAFFTLFNGLTSLHSMESAVVAARSTEAAETFHSQLAGNLTASLEAFTKRKDGSSTPPAEAKQLEATVAIIEQTLAEWQGLSFLIDESSFQGIFKHMSAVYPKFVLSTKRQETGNEQVLNNNIAFVKFVRKYWDAIVRACESLGTDNLTPEKIYLLITTINTFGDIPTTEALAEYNTPGYKKLVFASLDGEMLLLLTQCYEYFLTRITSSPSVFGINTLRALQDAVSKAKPLTAEATPKQTKDRQLALADLSTAIIKSCLDQEIFSVYEDNRISIEVDAAANILGITKGPKKLRAEKRKMADPSHRLFESLVAFIPLLLMSTMNSMLAAHFGDTGAYTLMVLNICTMLSTMLWGNNKLVKALSFINPMRLAPIIWLVRSAGHKAIDCLVAKNGSKSWVNPLALVAAIGHGTYQIYTIGRVFLPITYSILSSIILTGAKVAGDAYAIAVEMLYNLPRLFSSKEFVTV